MAKKRILWSAARVKRTFKLQLLLQKVQPVPEPSTLILPLFQDTSDEHLVLFAPLHWVPCFLFACCAAICRVNTSQHMASKQHLRENFLHVKHAITYSPRSYPCWWVTHMFPAASILVFFQQGPRSLNSSPKEKEEKINSHAKVRLASRLTMVPKELEARHWYVPASWSLFRWLILRLPPERL